MLRNFEYDYQVGEEEEKGAEEQQGEERRRMRGGFQQILRGSGRQSQEAWRGRTDTHRHTQTHTQGRERAREREWGRGWENEGRRERRNTIAATHIYYIYDAMHKYILYMKYISVDMIYRRNRSNIEK